MFVFQKLFVHEKTYCFHNVYVQLMVLKMFWFEYVFNGFLFYFVIFGHLQKHTKHAKTRQNKNKTTNIIETPH